jgi:hypothetical protein
MRDGHDLWGPILSQGQDPFPMPQWLYDQLPPAARVGVVPLRNSEEGVRDGREDAVTGRLH